MTTAPPRASVPNVVVYVSHDTGRHISPYGIATVRTPNAERVAQEGVLFERAFCTAPHCSPSRASLFTGRYPHANGVMGLTGAVFGWDLNEGEVHAAQHFRALGYETALIGIAHETHTKERRGFDFIDGETYAGRVGGVFDRWLAQRADRRRPFFVQIGTHETHRPFLRDRVRPDAELGITIPPWLQDGEATRADFAELQGSVARWDEGLGALLDALDRHGAGDDTLLVVTTDHGLPMPRAKATLYDPGIEVMLLMRWPNGGLDTGRRYSELVSNADVLPTLLDAVGWAPDGGEGSRGSLGSRGDQASRSNRAVGESPNGPGGGPAFHGRSLWPLLAGHGYEAAAMVFVEKTFHTYYDPMRGVRTERFKYIRNFEMAAGVMLASVHTLSVATPSSGPWGSNCSARKRCSSATTASCAQGESVRNCCSARASRLAGPTTASARFSALRRSACCTSTPRTYCSLCRRASLRPNSGANRW